MVHYACTTEQIIAYIHTYVDAYCEYHKSRRREGRSNGTKENENKQLETKVRISNEREESMLAERSV